MNEVELTLAQGQLEESQSDAKQLYHVVKRVLDIVLSSICIVVLAPFFVILCLCIKMDSKGSVFYKHKRIGKNGKYIYLYKFRSMYSDAQIRLQELLKDDTIKKEWEENFKLDQDPRITRIGKFLRKTSLDELPQLFNILKGDMSLVGPRPVIADEIEKYGMNKKRFLSVLPGLTGWWACNGRSCTSYDERIYLELYYVQNQSLSLDAKIVFKTIASVLQRNGAK